MSDITEFMAKIAPKAPLKVVELFAGVGGFHLGLDAAGGYEVVFGNQWEPSTHVQHAFNIYAKHFKTSELSNTDISKVSTKDIPDHDLLVGGFPCQDYSVARTLSHAAGIVGKKGVLWWQIHRILKEKKSAKPQYLMLENVDRLLKSPVKQRGRDFALMLASLSALGYIVEWRVINAAEYGMPQRRRRIFIMGYMKGSPIHARINDLKDPFEWILAQGTIATAFPVTTENDHLPEPSITLGHDLADISEKFNSKGGDSPFRNAGIMIEGKVYTQAVIPQHKGERTTLKDIVIDEAKVPAEYFIPAKDLARWKYLKGAKKEARKSKSGHKYFYSEGPMAFPDPLNKPARTIITGEGGSTPSRFKHVVTTSSGKYRRLTPEELEKINMFPPGHTAKGKDDKPMTDARRAFFMGNALVVGIIERLGKELQRQLKLKPQPSKKEPIAA